MDRAWTWTVFLSVVGVALSAAGCGKEETTVEQPEPSGEQVASTSPAQLPESVQQVPGPIESGQSEPPQQPAEAILPVVALTPSAQPDKTPDDEPAKFTEPKEETAEWCLLKITQIRVRPLPKTEDFNEIGQVQLARNREIVELATRAIALTHKDTEKERIFDAAVQQLMEATLQLALQGDQDSVDALYDHSESLYQRDPASKAAVSSALTVARFVFACAERFASQEPRWLSEYARQARVFASRFGHDKPRATSLLLKAGRSCDLYGLNEEAIGCYSDLQAKFPESAQAKQVTGFLRRLSLEGKPLELAGPTLDGGFLSIDEFKGHPTLVVFWTTGARRFLEQLPTLAEAIKSCEGQGLKVLSVNLDSDAQKVEAFLDQNPLGWPVVFYSSEDDRGWNNPIAAYYGILDLPQIWLISPEGTVKSIRVAPHQLKDRIEQ